ncbi:hypothetical protein [Thermoanaerobacterium sp. DL9XJH110]|uniref:hypothetical protein n=1 Tax=Thermoanaerobacterium sp. DL9XJH110 TaxID=3386643 RepID=UPI003BB6FB5B
MYLLFFFYGKPWESEKYRKEVIDYLKNKYTEPMIIREISYDFLHNRYSTEAFPESHPELVFNIRNFKDDYNIVLWRHQARNDFESVLKDIYGYPEKCTFSAEPDRDEILDLQLDFQGKIPDYITAKVPIEIDIAIRYGLTKENKKREYEKLLDLIDFIKDKKMQITFIMVEYNQSGQYFKIPEEFLHEINDADDLSKWLFYDRD